MTAPWSRGGSHKGRQSRGGGGGREDEEVDAAQEAGSWDIEEGQQGEEEEEHDPELANSTWESMEAEAGREGEGSGTVRVVNWAVVSRG